ncbi:MAG TPA: asparagine synthase (glutamine-hydrolyzing) [Vicinamibacterales bacterium]|nr:asparagine synthase (glutamine-hydrolyzing) [Vicinamibacterales bacterium]
MCGIFGMFGPSSGDERGKAAAEAIRLMRHRGPDDSGSLDVGDGVLANRRLAIVDLNPTGHQPMTLDAPRLAITFNGEVYNYVELQDELRSRYAFRGHSDTETILAAYATWGDDFLSRLRGMFALAIWDADRRRLLVATDRLSIKPVLWHAANGRLVFASEVKPLAAAGVPLAVNGRRVYEYLQSGALDHSRDTLFDGIQQLRPGTFLTWQDGRVTESRYWDLSASDADDRRGDVLVDAIDAMLQEAVDLHLRGDVEPALSLSSGLDSQVLRALIQRDGRRPGLHCFTHCFPGTPYDECTPARALLGGAPVHWHGTVVSPDGLLAELDKLIYTMEAPVGGLGIYGYWLNSRTASEHGFKVLLDGQGGDEAFAGYRYYYGALLGDLARRGDRVTLDAELAAFNHAHGSRIAYPSAEFDALVAPAETTGVRAPDGTSLGGDYVAAGFAAAHRDRPADPLPTPFADPVKNAMYADLFFLKIPKLLRFQDRAAMAWSVEVRVPFLDHVLLETLLRVPSDVLLSGGVTKGLLRRIAASRLGLAMAHPKLYVSAPQREWIKTSLRDGCRALMHESALAAGGYVDATALLDQYDRYVASPELGNSFFVWKFVNLELWYRRFIASPIAVATPSITHA